MTALRMETRTIHVVALSAILNDSGDWLPMVTVVSTSNDHDGPATAWCLPVDQAAALAHQLIGLVALEREHGIDNLISEGLVYDLAEARS